MLPISVSPKFLCQSSASSSSNCHLSAQLHKVVGLLAANSKGPGEQFISQHSSLLLYFGTLSSLQDESAALQAGWGGMLHNLSYSTISPSCCICKLRALTLRAMLVAFIALYFMGYITDVCFTTWEMLLFRICMLRPSSVSVLLQCVDYFPSEKSYLDIYIWI